MEVYAIEFAGFYADSTSVTRLNINFYQTCFGILGESLFWTKGDAGRFSAETTHLRDKHTLIGKCPDPYSRYLRIDP
jgi:hypothetical protein